MSIVARFRVACDKCKTVHDDDHGTIEWLEKCRTGEGWAMGDKDLCPECNGNDPQYWHFGNA